MCENSSRTPDGIDAEPQVNPSQLEQAQSELRNAGGDGDDDNRPNRMVRLQFDVMPDWYGRDQRPHYMQLELPLWCEVGPFHCPVCGQPVEEGQHGYFAITPCAHLVFRSSIDGFRYESEDFRKRTAGINDEGWRLMHLFELLQLAEYGTELFAIEVHQPGLGDSGLTEDFLGYGFDFGSLIQPLPDRELDSAPAATSDPSECIKVYG